MVIEVELDGKVKRLRSRINNRKIENRRGLMLGERRFYARQGLDLPVYIRYHKRPFRTATARSVSENGMLLSVKSLTLPAGTAIELELHALGKRWLLPAIVIHGDNSGIAVMFGAPQNDLFNELSHETNTAMPPVIGAESGKSQPLAGISPTN
ncbi:MAG: PilZ domain-containing protein [Lamprobacter sp.]|uniref:PilZ domain-containing protein n=1 Tax=Lamprobacter sp. TaxID=3100796 RepID=UPI002B2618F7|nr:PilZ domain-containing protein [Lamprobacter sp.]MEA3641123.1 PilZ domain-containing protein [Lamprobacter sp.]